MQPEHNNLLHDARTAAQGRKASERLAQHSPQQVIEAVQNDIATRRQTFTKLRRPQTD